jgi:hypothetical protein
MVDQAIKQRTCRKTGEEWTFQTQQYSRASQVTSVSAHFLNFLTAAGNSVSSSSRKEESFLLIRLIDNFTFFRVWQPVLFDIQFPIMDTIIQNLDDLDRMVDSNRAPKDELRIQISLIRSQVSSLITDYARLADAHADLQTEHAKLKHSQSKRGPEDDLGISGK